MRFVLTGTRKPFKPCLYLTRSRLNAATVSNLLAPAGYNVVPAEKLEGKPPGVILIDADCQWETAVRSLSEQHPHTSVIVVTDWSETPTWEQVILAGGYDSVSLDRLADQLVDTVNSAENCARMCADSAASQRRHDALMEAVRDSVRRPI
jgi:DNA-binding NarL/FixJ family response regulator